MRFVIGNLFVIISVRHFHGLIRLKRKRSSQRKKLLSKERLEKIKKPKIAAFLGEHLSRDNHIVAIITAALILILFIFILLFRKKIMGKIMDESDT